LIRWLLRIALILALIVGVAAGIAVAVVSKKLSEPYRAFEGDKLIEIQRGSSTRAIAKQLAEAGVIKEDWMLLAARILDRKGALQAGEYEFKDAATVWDVVDRLKRGDVFTFEFTVPEGSNIWDIARLLEMQHIMNERDFLAAASDPVFVQDIAPEAESLEGYLFPATYRLSHKTTARDLCRMMVEQFKRQWKTIGGELAPHPIVTLASLVEEETSVPAERETIAGVFSNRLHKGMQLAADPTIMYASHLMGTFHGRIYKADLKRPHPYNTYLNTGLPPGPISSPGKASIEAAMHPGQTQAIYFVSNPEGTGHIFSPNLAAHTRAVQSYRDARAAAKAAKAQEAIQAN
jgi:UPF0755 protein